jgi:hypothetical protein
MSGLMRIGVAGAGLSRGQAELQRTQYDDPI